MTGVCWLNICLILRYLATGGADAADVHPPAATSNVSEVAETPDLGEMEGDKAELGPSPGAGQVSKWRHFSRTQQLSPPTRVVL